MSITVDIKLLDSIIFLNSFSIFVIIVLVMLYTELNLLNGIAYIKLYQK